MIDVPPSNERDEDNKPYYCEKCRKESYTSVILICAGGNDVEYCKDYNYNIFYIEYIIE